MIFQQSLDPDYFAKWRRRTEQPLSERQPELPAHQPHSETSKAAAESVRHEAVHAREQVLAEINRNGWHGCTDDELISRLPYGESSRPRRIELVRAGLVVDSRAKRATAKGRLATVWVGKEFAR